MGTCNGLCLLHDVYYVHRSSILNPFLGPYTVQMPMRKDKPVTTKCTAFDEVKSEVLYVYPSSLDPKSRPYSAPVSLCSHTCLLNPSRQKHTYIYTNCHNIFVELFHKDLMSSWIVKSAYDGCACVTSGCMCRSETLSSVWKAKQIPSSFDCLFAQ